VDSELNKLLVKFFYGLAGILIERLLERDRDVWIE